MVVTLNKKINLIIPNYSNLGFNLIILKNNDYNLIVPNI